MASAGDVRRASESLHRTPHGPPLRHGPPVARGGAGREKSSLQMSAKIGLGALALIGGAALFASRPSATPHPAGQSPEVVQAHLRLAAVSPQSRRDIDYGMLDQRLQRLMTKPAMVGLAVGVVENGRITFLKGYGTTLEGSGEPVTPATVFRWASCSKGLAATMVAKLAEQGKIDLNAPVGKYAPDLKLPNGNEYRANVIDLLSHRLGLYRDAYADKLEDGGDPSMLRRSLAQLDAVCAPGTCWSYQNVAYDASSEIVSRTTGLPYEQAVRRYLFNPIGMTSGSVSMQGLESNQSWARPHSSGRRPWPMVDTYY
jgi:beta-lactamase class C